MSEKEISISLDGVDLLGFLGHQDANLRLLEDHFPGMLVLRGDQLILRGPGEDVRRMKEIVDELLSWARSGRMLDRSSIGRILEGNSLSVQQAEEASVFVQAEKKIGIHPRSPGQAAYMEAIRTHEIVFGIGPAGTGKTYLAVVMAVKALQERKIDRIILVRPAVEAGEQLGFLPGDLQEKVDPYLRPLYDALTECMGASRVARSLSNGVIEVAPLAYMRGRTLNRSFVILDEGQNTTLTQMKMFLTRMGEGSQVVVTGDITQIDLHNPHLSGLIRVRNILQSVPGVAFIHLDEVDVVRHPLVRKIVAAFSESEVDHSVESEESDFRSVDRSGETQ